MRDHLTHSMISLSAICTTLEDTVADPDLQIGGGGGGGGVIHKGGARCQKKYSLALRASVWTNKKGGAGPTGPLPRIRH